jgi:hypothetical protein
LENLKILRGFRFSAPYKTPFINIPQNRKNVKRFAKNYRLLLTVLFLRFFITGPIVCRLINGRGNGNPIAGRLIRIKTIVHSVGPRVLAENLPGNSPHLKPERSAVLSMVNKKR